MLQPVSGRLSRRLSFVAFRMTSQVNAEATKIGREAEEADAIAQQVQIELDRALPALQAAEEVRLLPSSAPCYRCCYRC